MIVEPQVNEAPPPRRANSGDDRTDMVLETESTELSSDAEVLPAENLHVPISHSDAETVVSRWLLAQPLDFKRVKDPLMAMTVREFLQPRSKPSVDGYFPSPGRLSHGIVNPDDKCNETDEIIIECNDNVNIAMQPHNTEEIGTCHFTIIKAHLERSPFFDNFFKGDTYVARAGLKLRCPRDPIFVWDLVKSYLELGTDRFFASTIVQHAYKLRIADRCIALVRLYTLARDLELYGLRLMTFEALEAIEDNVIRAPNVITLARYIFGEQCGEPMPRLIEWVLKWMFHYRNELFVSKSWATMVEQGLPALREHWEQISEPLRREELIKEKNRRNAGSRATNGLESQVGEVILMGSPSQIPGTPKKRTGRTGKQPNTPQKPNKSSGSSVYSMTPNKDAKAFSGQASSAAHKCPSPSKRTFTKVERIEPLEAITDDEECSKYVEPSLGVNATESGEPGNANVSPLGRDLAYGEEGGVQSSGGQEEAVSEGKRPLRNDYSDTCLGCFGQGERKELSSVPESPIYPEYENDVDHGLSAVEEGKMKDGLQNQNMDDHILPATRYEPQARSGLPNSISAPALLLIRDLVAPDNLDYTAHSTDKSRSASFNDKPSGVNEGCAGRRGVVPTAEALAPDPDNWPLAPLPLGEDEPFFSGRGGQKLETDSEAAQSELLNAPIETALAMPIIRVSNAGMDGHISPRIIDVQVPRPDLPFNDSKAREIMGIHNFDDGEVTGTGHRPFGIFHFKPKQLIGRFLSAKRSED